MAATSRFAELGRFCLVGGSGVLVNLAVFQGALTLGVPVLAASAFAFVTAASSNFLLNRAWTFGGAPSREGTAVRWAKFLVASAAGLAANLAVLAVLPAWFSIPSLPAQLAGIAAGTLLNYRLSRDWVFRPETPAPAPS
jgi:dolichol-phosphate mannosyltransferase